jgi:hypothetical protein
MCCWATMPGGETISQNCLTMGPYLHLFVENMVIHVWKVVTNLSPQNLKI